MMDDALCDVIENGQTLPKTQVVEGVITFMPITSVEDKAQRMLEVKERSTLMMEMLPQRNLLKQQYENFTASNSEMLDQTFDRLQKLNTHAVVWRNKADRDTISMEDLYNNLKVYEPEVKGTSSLNSNIQNLVIVSSSKNNSTNGVVITAQAVNTANGVSTGGPQVNTANIDGLSDAVICTFLDSQPRRKLTVNGNKTTRFDKSNVECYNRHKRGNFPRECRAPRSQDTKHKESTKRNVPMETPALITLVSCDGLGGYDWRNFMPPKPNLSFTRLDEFANKLVVENSDAKTSETKPKNVKKNTNALIIKEWVSDDKGEEMIQPKFKQKTVKPSIPKIEFVKPKQPEKKARKTIKQFFISFKSFLIFVCMIVEMIRLSCGIKSQAGSDNRPPMLNKENYVPWSSRLLRLPEDIYVAVDSCETPQEIWLRVQQMIKVSDIGIQEKKAKLFNEWERQMAQPGINMGQDRQMQMVGGNANQNSNGNGTLVVARAEGNATRHNENQIRCYNYRGVGHFARNCTVRPRRRDAAYLQTQMLIAQKEEAGIQLQAEEFDLMAATADLDEIEKVNANCILMANLQQASTSTKFVGDLKSLAKEGDESLAKHKTFKLEIERLLRAVYKKCEECKFDKISYDKAYNDMQQKIERLQAQLGDLKGKSKDTLCLSNTLNPLSHKLENENVELELQVSDKKDTTSGKSENTMFSKQSILGKPHKVGEIHALSKPVTSNSIPAPQGSKVMINDKLIAPGMFRIYPFKPSWEEKHVPNYVRASVRIKSITVSQPPVITKKVVNSDSNGLSSKGVDNTNTRRPQPRSNTKNDRVPSASKSSQSENKGVKVENVKSKVVCDMCKQCLNSVNHDVCFLNYVNGMNSRGKKQKANVSINEKEKKQQLKVKKTNKVGSIKRLASPKPIKPRSFLRWSPTRRRFDLQGKIIVSSELDSQSDCSKGDNACTSYPLEPTIKWFPNSTFSLAGTVRFGNDHVAAILGFGDLQWEIF
nr:hypothetical protein [Tanacetum cinerariifolium]